MCGRGAENALFETAGTARGSHSCRIEHEGRLYPHHVRLPSSIIWDRLRVSSAGWTIPSAYIKSAWDIHYAAESDGVTS